MIIPTGNGNDMTNTVIFAIYTSTFLTSAECDKATDRLDRLAADGLRAVKKILYPSDIDEDGAEIFGGQLRFRETKYFPQDRINRLIAKKIVTKTTIGELTGRVEEESLLVSSTTFNRFEAKNGTYMSMPLNTSVYMVSQ